MAQQQHPGALHEPQWATNLDQSWVPLYWEEEEEETLSMGTRNNSGVPFNIMMDVAVDVTETERPPRPDMLLRFEGHADLWWLPGDEVMYVRTVRIITLTLALRWNWL
jgi:hypothetical protein